MASLEIISAYRERARDDLSAAEEMLSSHFHLAAISRAYYGVFYAITAVLLEKDIVVHTHKELGIEFRRNFIKTEILPRKYSLLLEELFQARQSADYDAIPEIPEVRVKELIGETQKFVRVLNIIS